MATFDRIKKIVGSVVDTSTEQKLAELDKFAAEEPKNPAPPLVSAMVATVTRRDPPDVDGYLAEAKERLLDANPADKEMAFHLALYRVIDPELTLYELARNPNAPDRKAKAKNAAAASAKANADLGKAAKNLDNSFVDAVVASVHTLSWGHSIKSAHYQQGVKTLEKFASGGENQDFASFFLIYAHRRVRKYDAALEVAEDFEGRHPNNALLKKIIGSIHQFSGNANKAIEYFMQATLLASTDASAFHGLTQAHLAAAKAADAVAEMYDRTGEFDNLRSRLRL